jgi:hypothetical protein
MQIRGLFAKPTAPGGALVILLAAACLPGVNEADGVESGITACLPAETSKQFIASDTLDVLSLNLAHGRGRALNQMLVTRRRSIALEWWLRSRRVPGWRDRLQMFYTRTSCRHLVIHIWLGLDVEISAQ